MTTSPCRGCGAALSDVVVDLGVSPLANSYVDPSRAKEPEPFLPLTVLVCRSCLLVQLEAVASATAIFSEYAYFSSWSSSWVEHAARFAAVATERFALGPSSLVVELASNDGYLLRAFRDRGVGVLGVEPAANVAEVAIADGIPTVVDFFGTAVGERLRTDRAADLVVANNVLAHVPDLHDFVGGIAAVLAPDGWVAIEFPHLLRLIADVQYDTIYHEHFSYFSLLALLPVLAAHGLAAVDVEELATHGGSLRLYLSHADVAPSRTTGAVERVLAAERAAGLDRLDTYVAFGPAVHAVKRRILRTVFDLKERDLRICGYGAPAKGNTLLNHCGIGTDVIDFTVDANPAKQGTLLPGSRIPVLHPDALRDAAPDVVWLLPWNLRDELVAALGDLRERGTRFLVTQPEPHLLP